MTPLGAAPPTDFYLYETKEFHAQLRRLVRRGVQGQAAHRQVVNAMAAWANGGSPAGLVDRGPVAGGVPHARRYELDGSYVLLSYEHAGQRIPLMVGTADEAGDWLARHAGRDFTVNTTSGIVRFTPTGDDAATTAAVTRSMRPAPAAAGPVLDRLPPMLLAELKLPPPVLAAVNRVATFEAIDADEPAMWRELGTLPFGSAELQRVVAQVVALLAGGQEDEAAERVNVYRKVARPASAEAAAFAGAIGGTQNGDYVANLTGLSPDDIERLVGGSRLTDWMLFLHPEQRRLAEKEYNNGPARLIGVSGSGKTSVLIHRANELAKKYEDGQVLVLTLNPALGQLLAHLLDTLCGGRVRQRIRVETIYDYCKRAVNTIDPARLIERVDHRSGEDLRACWADFLDKPHALDTIRPVVDALERREGSIDAARYLLDELIWVRSGFGRENRQVYLACDRVGRGVQLPKLEIGADPRSKVNGFPADTRQRVLRLLGDYEEYMRAGGLMDEDGVSLEAYSLRDRIRDHQDLRARCVLVDEVQDCSTVELAVIAAIPTHAANGLFLVGDPVQKVYAKQHDLRRAGVDVQGRGSVLRTNYRNTRQILEAAFTILQAFQDLSPVPKSEILEPDYAFRDGPRPKLLECVDRDEQLRLIVWYLHSFRGGAGGGGEGLDDVCVCSCLEETLAAVERRCHEAGVPTHRIRGDSPTNAALQPGVKLVLMQDIKGYEFGHVFLADLMDGLLPPKGMPWDERWRAAFQIYVAMTRAREDLLMSFVFNRSILLGPLQGTVDDLLAAEVLPPGEVGPPTGTDGGPGGRSR